MKQLVVVVLVSACWSSSQPTRRDPAVADDDRAAYGGAAYGGAAYGGVTDERREIARNAGILGAMDVQGGAIASLTGPGDLSGDPDANIYGGLAGSGTGGADASGSGWGTVGTGGYGTIGHGSGTSLSGTVAPTPMATAGQATVTGNLDKAIIRRYVRRNLQKLQSCYERQLVVSPKLAGTVTAQFTIDVDGKVSAASATGVDANVASCVAKVLEAIEFPKPQGGGVVRVSYPFVFAPAPDDTTSAGYGGLGISGTGGGGSGYGTIGIGSYGTIGHGSGTGSGYGVGSGGLRSAPRTTTAKLGEATTKGALDKAIIRRYVKRNIQKFHYCYEKQLLKTPKLAGRVVATFTIGADGKVASSTATGLHADVDACVARVLGAIEFPKPTGGGVVMVNYPFLFAPTAEDAKSAR